MPTEKPIENTDTKLHVSEDGTCSMTVDKALSINYKGYVITKTFEEWHRMANAKDKILEYLDRIENAARRAREKL